MEHERCYVYTPTDVVEPAAKRQRISKADPYAKLPERLLTYREIWAQQEQRIQTTLEEADRTTQEKIVDFVVGAPEYDRHAIPTGLIMAGPSIASHGSFFERLGIRIKADTDSSYVLLTSSESPSLKTFLKNLIRKATSRVREDDEDDDLARTTTASGNGPRLLDFDLGHLQEWQSRNRVKSMVVAIQDSEAFDARVLVEMVELFYSWLDRLPFILLFGIATSAESFEDRLSGKSLRYLDGQKFDVTQSDEIIEKLFKATIAYANELVSESTEEYTTVLPRIGPNIAQRILDRQKDHVQNTQDFADGLKYAYMSHFYASYPTVFLGKGLSFDDVDSDAFEAVRNLPSFRRWIGAKLDAGETQDARKLLDSNQYLFDSVMNHLRSGEESLNRLSTTVHLFAQIRESLQLSPSLRLSSIWIKAASADLLGSPLLRETMLSLKKVSSDKLLRLLDAIKTTFAPEACLYQRELEELTRSSSAETPLRSQYDVRNESVRTTVVAQKVLLSKHKATLSEQDKAYSDLVGRFHDAIESWFSSQFINPQDLFLSEILMYDLRSPHTEVFQPRPRFAIERALSSPHDYLGCTCCSAEGVRDGESSLASTQPATAILYQLYLESGALINVSDLWAAFNAIVGEGGEDEDSKTMALFQRALGELKFLGFVKPSRKKTDHIAKMMWKGL